jgi:hypothetical protein
MSHGSQKGNLIEYTASSLWLTLQKALQKGLSSHYFAIYQSLNLVDNGCTALAYPFKYLVLLMEPQLIDELGQLLYQQLPEGIELKVDMHCLLFGVD